MVSQKSSAYQTYLVRCWREESGSSDQEPPWRFSVEDILGERQRHGFGSLAEVVAYLQDGLGSETVQVLNESLAPSVVKKTMKKKE